MVYFFERERIIKKKEILFLVYFSRKNHPNLRGQASLTIIYLEMDDQKGNPNINSKKRHNVPQVGLLRYDRKDVFIAETKKHVPRIQVSGERRKRGRSMREGQRFLK